MLGYSTPVNTFLSQNGFLLRLHCDNDTRSNREWMCGKDGPRFPRPVYKNHIDRLAKKRRATTPNVLDMELKRIDFFRTVFHIDRYGRVRSLIVIVDCTIVALLIDHRPKE